MKPKHESVYRRGGVWAFLAVFLAVYAQVFIYGRGPWLTWHNGLFVGLGGFYLWAGTAWPFWSSQRAASLVRKLCYLALQVPLVTLILFLSPVPGNIGLLVLPLVSQVVFMLPWSLAGFFSALLYGVTLAHIAAPYGWRAAMDNSFGFLAAFVFVVAFSLIGQREACAREEAEALSAQLEEANQKLRAAAAQAEELAVARERNRLAREIHDGLGHYLTTIAVQLEAAQALLGGSPSPATEAIGKAAKLSQEALADVRRSVGALRVDAPHLALVDQLEQLALADPQLTVAVAVRGKARDLAPAIEHAFYRVAQEGLTNVRKHAGSLEAQVTLDFLAPSQVRLEVVDHGGGPAAGEPGAGFGLNGVRERVEQFGGRMQAAPRPQGGFGLSVEIPG
jgi:signal transduction histidine kinase